MVVRATGRTWNIQRRTGFGWARGAIVVGFRWLTRRWLRHYHRPRRLPARLSLARAGAAFLVLAAFACAGQHAIAQPFRLPTANRFLFDQGAEDKFFAATPGKTWTTGCFGCVRSDGWQMHEGLDIRSVQRDKHGEPTDPVMATADGTVAYVNTRPSLSNYGNYVVLRHVIEGVEVYSLYAHLHSVRAELKAGEAVRTGEVIGVMGRTANTRQGIAKDRAHVHFELNLFLNERFDAWHRKTFPGQRNDHGAWNGQNLAGVDPRTIFLAERNQGAGFSFLNFLRGQTDLCRVLVRQTDFPWLRRYPALIRRNPVAEREGVAGYELAFNFNGVPFAATPRAASEIRGRARFQLLSVNEAEYRRNPCRKLVRSRGGRWELAGNGLRLLDLLTY